LTKKSGLSPEETARVHSQLVKLGDLMGDGQHLEPGGKWITRDYNRILKALGLLPSKPRRNNGAAIDAAMADTLKSETCLKCGEGLKQSRAGSLRADCLGCGARYQVNYSQLKQRASKGATSSRALFFFDASLGAAG